MNEWAYILASSYSGSTLLTFLLGTHPEVATMGELKRSGKYNFEEYRCSCGERILECTFWARVRDEMRADGKAFDIDAFGTNLRFDDSPLANRALRASVRGPLFEATRATLLSALPGARKRMRRILDQIRDVSAVISRLQGGSIFLDGSKDATRLLHLWNARIANIKVIYLLRDGRGAAFSYMNHYGMSMASAALEWRRTYESCERLLARKPPDLWLMVRYESLCAEPETTLTRIFEFFGLDPMRVELDFRSVEHHILGNSMRLGSSSDIRLDEKWRSQLTDADLNIFDRIAGKFNRRLGYE